MSSIRAIFDALAAKLPRFTKFIAEGQNLQSSITHVLRNFNKVQELLKKAVTIAISEPLAPELQRILQFLEYAGAVRRMDPVSRGVKGRFQRFAIHYGILLETNSLFLGKSYSLEDAIRALTTRDAHAFARTTAQSLLGNDFQGRCTLDLAPCQQCKAPRPAEDARFCVKCGAALQDVSVYEELLQAPIDRLPLTPHKIQGLQTHTSIRTIQDILLDEETREVRRVPYVGPVWAARIRNAAEEYVSV